MKITLEIDKITIFERDHSTDRISFELPSLTTGFPNMEAMGWKAHSSIDVEKGIGRAWVEENFPGVPVEVIQA